MGLEMMALSLQVISHFITCGSVCGHVGGHSLFRRNGQPQLCSFCKNEKWFLSLFSKNNKERMGRKTESTPDHTGDIQPLSGLFGKP